MMQITVQKIYFDAIACGRKTVEGRVNTEKYKTLQPGMRIGFCAPEGNEVVYCFIEDLRVYQTFKDMLCQEGVENMLPGVDSLQKAIAIYEGFPGYADAVKEFGALAIRIRLCSC